MFLYLASVFIMIGLWVLNHFSSSESVSVDPRLVCPKKSHWLLGHAWVFLQNDLLDHTFSKFAKKLGGLYYLKLPFFLPRMYIVSDPAFIHQIIQDDLPKAKYGIESVVGKGLITSNGKQWREHRKLFEPLFSKTWIRDHVYPVMDSKVDRFIDVLHYYHKQYVDFYELSQLLTLDIISEVCLGDDFNLLCNHNHLLRKTLVDLFEEMAEQEINFFRSYNPLARIRFWRNHRTLRKFLMNYVKNPEMASLLHGVIQNAKQRSCRTVSFSEEDVIDHLVTFLFAGHDTTATLLTWTFVMMAKHPEKEAKALVEIQKVCHSDDSTFEDLSRLRYCRNILKEVLRMYPPASTLRVLPAGYQFQTTTGEIVIKRTANALISPYILCKSPKYWNDPDTFRPERFEKVAGRPPRRYTWIPFLTGPRRCIGEHFAMTEALLMLVKVLPKFRVRVNAAAADPSFVFRVTNVPRNVQLMVERR